MSVQGEMPPPPPPPPPRPSTAPPPDDITVEQAQALAEVAAMPRDNNPDNNNNNVQEQVLMGAALGQDGVEAPEVTDESGELVQQRFLQFLSTFSERVDTMDNIQPIDNDDEEARRGGRGEGEEDNLLLYPYVEQAHQMARRQLSRGGGGGGGFAMDSVDAADHHNATTTTTTSGFSNTLFLDFAHLLQADMELAEAIQADYCRFEPFLRKAVQAFVLEWHPELEDSSSSNNNNNNNTTTVTYFVAVHNFPTVLPIRALRTDTIGRLSAVSGTVTRTTEVRPELLTGAFRCAKCGLLAERIHQQYHYTRPTLCRNPRCKNTSPLHFVLETASSEFCDWQKLRVQENSNEIPAGSMPRSIDVMVRNEMVERCKAGDTCIFTGSLVVIPDGSALARAGEAPRRVSINGIRSDAATGGGGGVQGLAATGVRELTYRTCFVVSCVLPSDDYYDDATFWAGSASCSSSSSSKKKKKKTTASLLFGTQALESHEPTAEEVVMELSREERQEIREMRSTPNLYEQLAKSIAPSTFGHLEIKKGILLMLLGGVHKTTVDGIKLRGDINVCVVGDPSVAKSQFLKYVHAFLPTRSVYTSGKASSAAGLTAAVQRDHDTGEFCIEAGALMLADNGLCCIDEFDKMDPNDQVAIHEAMEQQTISITKAGIQATLNARASILAAANPIYGRYDRTKTLKANVALSAPILSRFDLFFVVLDECNPDSDRQVAQHILNVHRCVDNDSVKPPFTKEQMQRYIRFARTINPKITPESQRVMVDCYRRLRQGDSLGRSRSAYRITVRQLESLIRLSEALARLHCDQEVRPEYVQKAFRLLKTSIIQVETSDVDVEDDDDFGEDSGGDDDNGGGDNDENDNPGGNSDTFAPAEDDEDEPETQGMSDEPETQAFHPGEYGSEAARATVGGKRAASSVREGPSKKKKKTTKISFEEYEAMANMIATHLRSLEGETTGDEEGQESETRYLKWSEVVEWYLEQVEKDIGDSMERLEELRKKVNLVLGRLVNVDHILVFVGGQAPANKKERQETQLAVHPNYVVS